MPPHLDLLLANRALMDHDQPTPPAGPVSGGSGGLLAAVRPAIEPWDGQRGTTWIGIGRGRYDRENTDSEGRELVETERGAVRHRRLFVPEEQWQGHYLHTANAFLWPLLHLNQQPLWEQADSFPRPLTPSREDWESYLAVNNVFAEAAAEEPGAGMSWVHDYQLALVPGLLREMGSNRQIGFFLHTPFPDIDIVERAVDATGLEHFTAFVDGLLGANLVGFQTEGDARRFLRASERLSCAAPSDDGTIRLAGRSVRAGAYPVGVDVQAVETAARTGRLPEEVASWFKSEHPVLVGLERADYTKGIPERLRAISAAYATGARFHYVGLASPTRSGAPGYDHLERAIAEASEEAQRAAEAAGCHFLYAARSLPWDSVVALLRDADVVFTSSLSDGMNLVPLQAVIAQSGRPESERGAVVAGAGAGVAEAYARTAPGITAVDPLDEAAMVSALAAAAGGALPPISDGLISFVRAHDASRWAASFLDDLGDDR